jgi:Fur family transcriptional regulator, stress-responsive regulator
LTSSSIAAKFEPVTSRPDTQQRLREAGLRVTSTRIAVLEALDTVAGHVTADQVRQAVLARLGSVSVQTIYDVLGALTTAGLVRCLETPGHPARFETRVGDNHHHFICRNCGRTIDIDCAVGEAPCLTPQALPNGFAADEAEVTYWGVCSDCR